MKIKRKFVEDQYAKLIKEMYKDYIDIYLWALEDTCARINFDIIKF